MDKSVNIDLNTCDSVYCACGCPFFVQRTIIKRISGLQIGVGAAEQRMPINLLFCEKCGDMSDMSKQQYKGLKPPAFKDTEPDAKIVKLGD